MKKSFISWHLTSSISLYSSHLIFKDSICGREISTAITLQPNFKNEIVASPSPAPRSNTTGVFEFFLASLKASKTVLLYILFTLLMF